MADIFFYSLLPFGIQAGFVALAVMILRLLLRKAPKSLICALWGVVAVRLLIPIKIESVFSLIPRSEIIPDNIGVLRERTVVASLPNAPSATSVTNPSSDLLPGLSYAVVSISHMLEMLFITVWLIGIAVMLIYAVISYARLFRLTKESVLTDDGYYICDRIPSPFILGIIRPKIFLPSDICERDKPYVLAHERAHIKRKDHLWKPFGFLLLAVYWFNPLLWGAYILLCRDIELACDEKVIRDLGADSKKPYANALINAAAHRRIITACPLAFGETSVKSRIKNVLNYKKPAFWIVIVALALSVAVAVCFLTNPVSKDKDIATPDSAQVSPTEALFSKLEPQDAVNRFFQVNFDKFPIPTTKKDDWTWENAKAIYYGGTYLDGTWQVILLTDISGIDNFEPVGREIRYEKCEHSYEELNAAIDSIDRELEMMIDRGNDPDYIYRVIELSLLEDQNIIEVGIFNMTDELVDLFKEDFGDLDYLTFKNVTARPNDDIGNVNLIDVPHLIYANENVAFINGEGGGVIFYEFTGKQFRGRISHDFLLDLGCQSLYAAVSKDGRYIYLFDPYAYEKKYSVFDMIGGMITTYQKEFTPDETLFHFDDQDYEIKYDESGKNVSERIYRKDDIEYRLSVPGWRIENMELTVKNTKDNTEETYRIFERYI